MNLKDRIIALATAIGSDIKNLTTNKQDKLVDGTNLKTVNSQSLQGSGNINIAGNVSFTETTINFGAIDNPQNNTTTTVVDASVLSGSKIICTLSGTPTEDHSIDEIMVLEMGVYATNIVEGVGFDIQAFCKYKTYGQVKINYLITN